MYLSQEIIDSVVKNDKDLKRLIATDLFIIREPFERSDGSKPKDWHHIKIENITIIHGDLIVYFSYHRDEYTWTLRKGIL